MRRLWIVGPPGAGKTTLGRKLAQLWKIRHVELDALAWHEGWKRREACDFQRLVESATDGEDWVVDGNYTEAASILRARGVAVVSLCPPLSTCLARVIRRSFRRILTRELLWGTCRENPISFFKPDGMLLHTVREHARLESWLRTLEREGACVVRLASSAADPISSIGKALRI